MDERHYWFASKLQETFRFGGYDNPSLLEDFLSDFEVAETISRFLGPGEPGILFFYCEEEATDRETAIAASGFSRQLHVTSQLRKDVLSKSKVCLYVLRRNLAGEVDTSQLDKELFCGELRHSAISSLSTLLTEAYAPLLKRQRDWGACTRENVSNFLQTFDRLSSALSESAAEVLAHQVILHRPSAALVNSVMQQHGGRVFFTAEVVEECEQVVADWTDTIDSLLLEAMDERLEDPHGGIGAELQKWERRQILLCSVIEQLREREMKAVIAALIANKSKLLKKWRTIDVRLTDASNTTKDRVWFLSALQPLTDAINAAESPASIIGGTLPTLLVTVKQMESLSRAYAKSGYLGIVFKKVGNVLANCCKRLLGVSCNGDEIVSFWDSIFKAASSHAASEPHPLVNCLRECIQLSKAYKDLVQQTRDTLLGHHSSYGASTSTGSRKLLSKESMLVKMSSKASASSSKASTSNRLRSDLTEDGRSVAAFSSQIAGLQLQNSEKITEALADLASRAEKVLDITTTLGQLSSLHLNLTGLPRVTRLGSNVNIRMLNSDNSGLSSSERIPAVVVVDEQLKTIEQDGATTSSSDSLDENAMSTTVVCSLDQNGVSIAQVMFDSVRSLKGLLQQVCPSGLQHVFALTGTQRLLFQSCYKQYQALIEEAETKISEYIIVLCSQLTHSQEILDILKKFGPVSSRPALQAAVYKCSLLAFVKYSSELEDIQRYYEEHKACPLLAVGRPPIAGAVEWTRNLLRRVEQPMETFRNNAALMKTSESLPACKLHNKLATALLQCESVWLGRWKERATRAAGILQTHLLVCSNGPGAGGDEGGELKIPSITVNSQNGLMEILAEARALKQLGVPLPDAVTTLLSQERRIKQFHQLLQQTLNELYSAVSGIDPRLRKLFKNLVEMVTRLFLPGWTTLTWNMLNIDAFLHQIDTAATMLSSVVQETATILQWRVYGVIDSIRATSLYDEQLATSRPWHPAEFSVTMQDSLNTRADEVTRNSYLVMAALKEIVTLVHSKEDHLATQQSTKQQQQHRWVKPLEFLSPTSVGKKSKRGRHSSTIEPSPCMTTQAEVTSRSCSFQLVLRSVLKEFCVLLDEAIVKLVKKSHSQLCQSICQLPRVLAAAVMSSGREGEGGKKRGVQLLLKMKFSIPSVTLDPSIDNVNEQITLLSSSILNTLMQLLSWRDSNEGFNEGDDRLSLMREARNTLQLEQVLMQEHFEGLHPRVGKFIWSLKRFDSLWQNDLHATHKKYLESGPSDDQYKAMVEELLDSENAVVSLPDTITLPSLTLLTAPLKSSLKALASNWKTQFISLIHENAKACLDVLVERQEVMTAQLQRPVASGDLPSLRQVLELLQCIDNLQLTVDNEYLPVEDMYNMLRRFEPLLPRAESSEVDELREKWEELCNLASKVRHELLSEHRLVYEQEVDKQVKAFSVKTIQFRNSFDSEGPIVPGLTPTEAITRLGSFLTYNLELEEQRELLVAVQKLLNIPPSMFPELDHTQEELSYLRSLYSNYQEVMVFNDQFRQQLWVEVDLDNAAILVNQFWQSFVSLPQEQQEWEASRKLSQEIKQYQQVLPILEQLHGKEVRSRHWLQIMSVTGCNFQLEASIFRMGHLMDAQLANHSEEIETIVSNAKQELALENEFLSIEEEWTEQVLQIEPHPSSGDCPLLSPGSAHSLLEQLESARIQLFGMLMSRHVQHVKAEVAMWAEKLGGVSEVLQLWLSVQELWLSLQAVFSDPQTGKDFSGESVKFATLNTTWKNIMQRASVVKTCIQCCLEGEEQLLAALHRLNSEMEECKRSLVSYLATKRESFPRFYFLPDDCLLSILSNSGSTESVKPFLQSLFTGVSDLVTEGDTITAAVSPGGEELLLSQHVQLSTNVEHWMTSLLASTKTSIQQLLLQAMDSDLPSLEELVQYHVTQVACVALHHQWTKDCEQALLSCRYDRKALPGLRTKFNASVINRLSSLVMRRQWRHTEDAVTVQHRIRLEGMIVLSLWLRDIIDDMCLHKLKEKADFEWIRFPRLYLHASGDGRQEVRLQCLTSELSYGCEFLGCQPLPTFSLRDNCYMISLTRTIKEGLGSCVVSSPGHSRTEIIKGVAYLLGQFAAVLQCFSLTTGSAIANLFTGIAQDGSWGCFTDIHTLSPTSLSVLARCCDAISTALKAKHTTVLLPPGKQVPLSLSTAVFTTHLPVTSLSDWELPSTFSPLFRSFSLSPPDPYITLRSTCVALGFRNPRVLTQKLTTLLSLINEQLSLSDSCHQPRISVVAFKHAVEISATRLRALSSWTSFIIPGSSSKQALNVPGSSSKQDDVTQRTALTSGQSAPRAESKGRKLILSSQQAQIDHSIIADTISSLLGPRFSNEALPVFYSILHDVFGADFPNPQPRTKSSECGGLSQNQLPRFPSSSYQLPQDDMRDMLAEEAEKVGLYDGKNWLDKLHQLLNMSHIKQAIVLSGKESSGKTKALQTVIAALNTLSLSNGGTPIKLQRLYPGALSSVNELYGSFDQLSGGWTDGIFTSLFRKALKASQTTTWVCFDGPLESNWMHYLSELISSSKIMTLGSGEQLAMSNSTLKLLFETGRLQHASPDVLTHCGIVHFDSSVLGWKALATAWLASRRGDEADCVKRLMDLVMNQVVDFILNKSSVGDQQSEVSLTETCLSYLSSLINIYSETAEVFTVQHVERLLLFSIVWSFGGVLVSDRDKTRFTQLMKRLSNSLPDDTEFSVFDYYVDESGEWDVWMSRLSEKPCKGVNLLGTAFVETTKTIRTEVLLELAQAARKHVILVGPHASGKTSIAHHFLSSRALNYGKTESVKRIVLNGHTHSTDLHKFTKVQFQHRQGYTFGPPHNRLLQLLVDDLHVPLVGGAECTALEYLRQLVDSCGLHNLQKKNEWSAIEDLLIFATFSKTSENHLLHPRLKRHFAVIPVGEFTTVELNTVIPSIVNSLTGLADSNSAELLQKISQASISLYQHVTQSLQYSTTPGRQHYLFSLGQLESVLQGLCYLSKEATTPSKDSFFSSGSSSNKDSTLGKQESMCVASEDIGSQTLGTLWVYEVERAYGSGLCRSKDGEMLQKCAKDLAIQVFHLPLNRLEYVGYSSISTQITNTQEQGIQTPLSSMPEISLHPIQQWKSLRRSISHSMSRYHEENMPALHLKLSDNVIASVVGVHRAIKHPRGNCILVGSLGQPLEDIATLSLYIAGYAVHRMATSSDGAFHDQLRSLFRLAGLERKQVALLITEKDLFSREALAILNSLTASSELPTLFSTDEMEGLIQSMLPSIKKDFPNEQIDPESYFAAMIAQNVRIVLCVTPSWSLLNHEATQYQGMLKQCQVIWTQEWEKHYQQTEIKFFLVEDFSADVIPRKYRQSVRECVSAIHQCLLQQSGALKQAGITPSLSPGSTVSTPPRARKQQPSKTVTASFDCLMEKLIMLNHTQQQTTRLSSTKDVSDFEMFGGSENSFNLPYIGPKSLQLFLQALCRLYKEKSASVVTERSHLSKALGMLLKIRDKVREMQESLNIHKKALEEKSAISSQLLASITAKSCQRERTQAMMGCEGAVLSTMKMVAEQKRILVENEEDDSALLAMFAQGLTKKTNRLEEMLSRATQRLEVAEREERAAGELVKKNRDQALYWQSKIDRNMIDQLKYLNNPPALVGVVLELILTLLKSYGTPSVDQRRSSNAMEFPPQQSKKTVSSLSLKGSLRKSETVEKEHWLSLQQALGDSQNFLELLNSLKWEDGLPQEAINLIESRIATTANSDARVTSLLRWDSVGSSDTGGSGGGGGGASPGLITVAMAKHAAEAAAFMCGFAVSIVEYHRSMEPHKYAKERLSKLRKNVAEIEQDLVLQREKHTLEKSPQFADTKGEEEEDEEEVGEAVLQRINEELAAIKVQFDSAVMEKHTLKKSCQQLTEKLKLAKTILESFQGPEEKWTKSYSELPSNECLLANCILATAFIVYCGPLSPRARSQAFSLISAAITSTNLSLSEKDKKQLLTLSTVPLFLLQEADRHHLRMEGLPMDPSCVESACIILRQRLTGTWPLLLDPMGVADHWLKGREPNAIFINHEDTALASQLLQCVAEGKPLVVGDVDLQSLPSEGEHNPLRDVLMCRTTSDGKQPVKTTICGQEIDIHPNFRLYLVSHVFSGSVPAFVGCHCSVIMFHPEPAGLESLLLNHFLAIYNHKTFIEQRTLQEDVHTQILKTNELESQLVQALASDQEMELEQKVVNTLLQINKSYEFARDSLLQSKQNDEQMTTLQLASLNILAKRAAIITNTVLMMGSMRPAYKTSYSHILSVFTNYIKDTGSRIKGEDALMNLTNFGHSHFEKGYLDLDRLLFSFLLALEIETSLGRTTITERMVLLSLTPGTKFTVKGLVSQVPNDDAPVVNFGKKMLDWISEAQWQGVLMLASHFSWVHPLLSQLGNSGKDILWRALSEGPAPEALPQSEVYGQKLAPFLQQFLPMQRLLSTFVMRPDRKTHFVTVFISSVLGHRPFSASYFELNGLLKTLTPSSTPLLLYQNDPHLPVMKLENFSVKCRTQLTVHNLFGGETEKELSEMIAAVKNELADGQWILLNNIHTSPASLPHIVGLLGRVAGDRMEEERKGSGRNRKWKGRLWLSCHADHGAPLEVLGHCVCVAMDAPKNVLSNMVHSLMFCNQGDLIGLSSRLEWLPLLHNVIMFHIGLSLRHHTMPSAFCQAYNWNHTHLMDALRVCAQEFQYAEQLSAGIGGVKPVSWSGIRAMISEVVYGSLVTDSTDLQTVSALTEHWLHPGVHKREYGQYHIPSPFFTPNTRLPALIQAVESAYPPLTCTAELCGIHYTSQMCVDWQASIFHLIHRLHGHLEESFPMPLEPTHQAPRKTTLLGRKFSTLSLVSPVAKQASNIALASVSSQLTEKLPTSIQTPTLLLEQSLESVPSSLFSQSTSRLTEKSKDTCSTLVHNLKRIFEVFPTGLKKELVSERLRRVNMETPFGKFIASEVSRINEHLQLINASLMELHEKLKSSSKGDVFSTSSLVITANALLTLTVPLHWAQAVGPSSPPSSTWSLQEWMTDLALRHAFMDKVLSFGIEKMPTYWLGSFYHPQTLLSIFKQIHIAKGSSPEQLVYVGELTNRDKDHIRDPPSEGVFIYGAYLWGCYFEKTASMDLRDTPPRSSAPYSLPAVHLTVKPQTNVTLHSFFSAEQKLPYVHYCPCFATKSLRNTSPLFYLKVTSQDVASNKWITRNLFCTLRPF